MKEQLIRVYRLMQVDPKFWENLKGFESDTMQYYDEGHIFCIGITLSASDLENEYDFLKAVERYYATHDIDFKHFNFEVAFEVEGESFVTLRIIDIY